MFVRLAKRDPHLAKLIAEVERAHRTIGSAGKQLLAALKRLPQDGRVVKAAVATRIGDYVSAMREHMAIEERDLFPRARQVLDDHDLAEIDRAFTRVIDPIFEASLRDAYAAYSPLVRYLAEQPAFQQAVGALDRFRNQRLDVRRQCAGVGVRSCIPDQQLCRIAEFPRVAGHRARAVEPADCDAQQSEGGDLGRQ